MRATFRAVQELRPYLEDLARRVADAGKAGLDEALDGWVEAHSEDDTLGSMITQAQLQAEMGGQLMVATYESKKAKPLPVAMAADEPAPFFDVPFTEAIELYKASGIPREKEFLSLVDAYSSRSAEARQLLLTYLRDRSKAKIIEALEKGLDVRDYIADIQQFANDLGVGKEHPAYLETVFRTNTHTAYGAGRWRQLQDKELQETRPYVQYRAVMDSRTRDAHRVLDGLIFRADDPAFARIAPPNGFNCRCSVVSYEPKPGEKISGSVPREYEAERDFDRAPDSLVDESLLS